MKICAFGVPSKRYKPVRERPLTLGRMLKAFQKSALELYTH